MSLLVPLFAIGVFVGFCLAQVGMLRHWSVNRGPHWRAQASLNAVGAVLTGAAAILLASEKFVEGAWLVVVVIPLLVLLFTLVRRAYRRIGTALQLDGLPPRPTPEKSVVVVPVVSISRLTHEMLSTALSMGDRVVAVHVVLGSESEDTQETDTLVTNWGRWRPKVPLELVDAVDERGVPSRVLGPAIVDYLEKLDAAVRSRGTWRGTARSWSAV